MVCVQYGSMCKKMVGSMCEKIYFFNNFIIQDDCINH